MVRTILHPPESLSTNHKTLIQHPSIHTLHTAAISPGLVETDFASAMDPTVIAGVRENYAKITPFGRSGTPDDIAQIAAFLASEGSRWVTGSTVSASGGRILY
jgi:NAD(P)-dependent dehydrogenase (short-subunit alcohol dehydrogenase family)